MSSGVRLASTVAGLALILSACGGEEAAQSAGAAGTKLAAAPTPADAYAPSLSVPSSPPDDPVAKLLILAVRNADLPSKSEVGIPAYPGARIMSTMAASTMEVNGEEVEGLPALAMLSGDEISEVVKFYKQNLEGWQSEEFYGSYIFWDGPADANPLDISLPYPTLGIIPLDESGTEASIWPDMKTRIDMRYRSGGG